ncbi:DUF6577 family protein [Chlorobium sp. N1]|uniref:DUF6577 family protein n=1 Tax=Chlorobium sp. N1 TaxID=2491138 RepID=UPI001039BA29|nr:DUF6577 family protein [Chlorobium sp. N1]TCD48861.1 hypothetical protein E0L29_02970 [Chlorobium sp. N1]
MTTQRNVTIDSLLRHFAGRPHVSRDELLHYYRSFVPGLNESTFAWRIHSLKGKGVIQPVRRGVYALSRKPVFHPKPEPKVTAIAMQLRSRFPHMRYCVWNTRWLNEWMIHQPGRYQILVEVEAEMAESVFYYLKDEYHTNVYLDPDKLTLERYIHEEPQAVIVRRLISKAPLDKGKTIPTPSLEKILVDLFVDRSLFSAFQGSELPHIFDTAQETYTLNITRMTAYAKRRGKATELIAFLTTNTRIGEAPGV